MQIVNILNKYYKLIISPYCSKVLTESFTVLEKKNHKNHYKMIILSTVVIFYP
jgi:hypothetical protein